MGDDVITYEVYTVGFSLPAGENIVGECRFESRHEKLELGDGTSCNGSDESGSGRSSPRTTSAQSDEGRRSRSNSKLISGGESGL